MPAPTTLKAKRYVFQGGFYVDGRFLKAPVDVTFAAGRQNKVPVLLGNNQQEFPVLALAPEQQKITDQEFLASLVQEFGAQGGKQLYALYNPATYAGKTLPGLSPASYAMVDVLNATLVSAPVRKIARLLSAGQPTYRFVVSQAYQQSIQNLICSALPVCGKQSVFLGTFHGMELPLTLQHIDEFYRDVIQTRSQPLKVFPSLTEQAAQLNFLVAYGSFAHAGVAPGWTLYQAKTDVANDVNATVKPIPGYQRQAGDIFEAAYPSLGVGF